jgi:predicted dehydrogenase
MDMLRIPRQQQLPVNPRPIVMIGAGGIVRDAHLLAYRKALFPVSSICDLHIDRARHLATEYGIAATFSDFKQAIASAPGNAVFDLALPPKALPSVLEVIPPGSPVLVQKPFGENPSDALELCGICRRGQLLAVVSFQLRWAPFVVAARHLLDYSIGDIHDIEVRVVANTPWHLWDFMFDVPRAEILYHSIHYIDLIRSFWGNPKGIYAKTLRNTRTERLASTRTIIVPDYGNRHHCLLEGRNY